MVWILLGEVSNQWLDIVDIAMYEGRSESKERFFHTKLFIYNRKEAEYAGFITHLQLLLHIVTLDIEALVVP